MLHKTHLFRAAALYAVVCFAGAASAQYQFTDLGHYAPFAESRALAVTEDGLVAGVASEPGSRVFRWTPEFGFVPVFGASSVTDINGTGHVMVGPSGRWSRTTGTWQALIGDECHDFCPPDGCIVCGTLREVNAVSSDGRIVVGRADNTPLPGGEPRPCEWYPWSPNAFELPASCIDPYNNEIRVFAARCISANGRFTGGIDFSRKMGVACGGGKTWDNQTGAVRAIALFNLDYGEVRAITSDGAWLAGIHSVGVPISGPFGPIARRIASDGSSIIDIDGDNPPTGAYRPVISGMTDDGSRMVGYRVSPTNVKHTAWIWIDGQGKSNLGDFMASNGLPVAGWTFTAVYDISFNGRFVVGEGLNPSGQVTAWRLEMPMSSVICDTIDFNSDTSLFDPQDIDAFLSVYSEGPCIPANASCNDIDFNNDGSLFDPCDIDAFLLVFSEGPCTPCGQ